MFRINWCKYVQISGIFKGVSWQLVIGRLSKNWNGSRIKSPWKPLLAFYLNLFKQYSKNLWNKLMSQRIWFMELENHDCLSFIKIYLQIHWTRISIFKLGNKIKKRKHLQLDVSFLSIGSSSGVLPKSAWYRIWNTF